MTSSGR